MRRLFLLLALMPALAYGDYSPLPGLLAWRIANSDTNVVESPWPTNAFVMTWNVSVTTAVAVTAVNVSNYNATIDWGDFTPTNTVTTYNDADLTHSYASTGLYTIVITGTFRGIGINNNANKLYPIRVDQLGSTGWRSFNNGFYGCANLTNVNGAGFDFSGVTSWQNAFRSCTKLVDIAGESGFVSAKATSTALASMFQGCTNLPSLDLSGWDTTNCTSLSATFRDCDRLTTVGDISGWKVNGITTMANAFNECYKLTSLNTTGWVLTNVNSMLSAFYFCTNLTTLDVSTWDLRNATSLGTTFRDCQRLTSASILKIGSRVTSAINMYLNADEVTGDVSAWTIDTVSSNLFLGLQNADGLTYSATNGSFKNIAHKINIQWSSATLSSNEVEYIFADLDYSGKTNGTINVTGTGNEAPTAQGLVHKASLTNKAWTVTHN